MSVSLESMKKNKEGFWVYLCKHLLICYHVLCHAGCLNWVLHSMYIHVYMYIPFTNMGIIPQASPSYQRANVELLHKKTGNNDIIPLYSQLSGELEVYLSAKGWWYTSTSSLLHSLSPSPPSSINTSYWSSKGQVQLVCTCVSLCMCMHGMVAQLLWNIHVCSEPPNTDSLLYV